MFQGVGYIVRPPAPHEAIFRNIGGGYRLAFAFPVGIASPCNEGH